ncbi:MAG: sterol desaturase family protein [Myxococcales bacterium]|nr:sterol desaturase family protein [Myxococcales bacterium]
MPAWLEDWAILSPLIITLSAWGYVALERLLPHDRGQKLFRKGWFNDFFLYSIAQSYVLGLVIAELIAFIDTSTGWSRLGLVSGWPIWAQLVFFTVSHDLYIYAFHRLQHKSPILWRIHEAHHSVENVDWLAGSRSHALEILINQTIEFAPIVLLGAPPEVALMKGTIDAVWGMFIHSNIDVSLGPLRKIINGPRLHRWHHSLHYEGAGFNYGTKLAIWDFLFGTAHDTEEKPVAYGLEEPFPEGYVAQQLYAFRPLSSSRGELERRGSGKAQRDPIDAGGAELTVAPGEVGVVERRGVVVEEEVVVSHRPDARETGVAVRR